MNRGGPVARATGGPAACVVLLIGLSVLRFASPDTEGIMLFAVIPIALLGIMLGFRAALLAALYASAVTLVWAATSSHAETAQFLGEPLTFLLLGGLSGYYAKGALGDFDLGRARICARLRRAISQAEVGLYYQPILRPGGELLALEGLARWRPSPEEIIPPVEFIPAAECDERTIWELTLHTVEQAVRDADAFGDGPVVAVNLSPVSLRRRELAGEIGRILRDGGLPASRLAVEVTESAIAGRDEAAVIDVLGEIQGLGVKMIAIDDFGIGHSSLSRLGRLPIDTVKIDRALIADSGRPETAAVIRGMIDLAHAIDLTVIAEGVEDRRTGDWLMEVHCDAMQGFEYSRPMPPDQTRDWLQGHNGAVA